MNPRRRRERPVSWAGLDDGDREGTSGAVEWPLSRLWVSGGRINTMVGFAAQPGTDTRSRHSERSVWVRVRGPLSLPHHLGHFESPWSRLPVHPLAPGSKSCVAIVPAARRRDPGSPCSPRRQVADSWTAGNGIGVLPLNPLWRAVVSVRVQIRGVRGHEPLKREDHRVVSLPSKTGWAPCSVDPPLW